jgi:hypothetical protein
MTLLSRSISRACDLQPGPANKRKERPFGRSLILRRLAAPGRAPKIDRTRTTDHANSRADDAADNHAWRTADQTNASSNTGTGKAAIAHCGSAAAQKRAGQDQQSNRFHLLDPL